MANLTGVWGHLIEEYTTHLKAIGRPDTTIRLRREQLQYLARSLNKPANNITHKDLVNWFGSHAWARETRRSYHFGVRGFFAWAHTNERITHDPAAALARIKPAHAVARPAPEHVWAATQLVADTRLTLILRLAAELGMRRSEIAAVHTRDLRHGPRGAQLHVHGKGGRDRILPVAARLAELIEQGAAGHTPGAPAEGWLFPNQNGGHLTPKWIGIMCSRAMPGIWTLHTLRHRFASRAYRATRNLPAVQALLGHASIATTQRYLAVDDDEIRAAMEAAA